MAPHEFSQNIKHLQSVNVTNVMDKSNLSADLSLLGSDTLSHFTPCPHHLALPLCFAHSHFGVGCLVQIKAQAETLGLNSLGNRDFPLQTKGSEIL